MKFPLFHKLEESYQSIKLQVFTGCLLFVQLGGEGGDIRIISYSPYSQVAEYFGSEEIQPIHKKQSKSNFVLSCKIQTLSAMGVHRGTEEQV
jgi:hypothetical protein